MLNSACWRLEPRPRQIDVIYVDAVMVVVVIVDASSVDGCTELGFDDNNATAVGVVAQLCFSFHSMAPGDYSRRARRISPIR